MARRTHARFHRTSVLTLTAALLVLVPAGSAFACGGLVTVERHRQPHAHDDARRVPRRDRALRDRVRVRGRRRHRGRLDRPAARRSDPGDQGRRLDAAAVGHRDQPARPGRARRGGQRGRWREGPPRDADRRARHHGAEGRRGRRGHVGPRPRLLPPAGRARGPGVLRGAQPHLHGRQVRRRPRERPGRPAGPGHACPRGHPHAEPVGAAAHPGARAATKPTWCRRTYSC